MVKTAFIKFIDDNNCLCPIIFTNGMSLALTSDGKSTLDHHQVTTLRSSANECLCKGGEKIYCKISLENGAEYVAVKPGLFLSNLVSIKVQATENLEHPLTLERIQPKSFKLNLIYSR